MTNVHLYFRHPTCLQWRKIWGAFLIIDAQREKGTLCLCVIRVLYFSEIQRFKIGKSHNFQLHHSLILVSTPISHTKTLTASLLLAGYPKAITASSSVVNRHNINFNAVSFILETGFFSGEIGIFKKVSTLDFFYSFSQFSSLFRLLDYNQIPLREFFPNSFFLQRKIQINWNLSASKCSTELRQVVLSSFYQCVKSTNQHNPTRRRQ